MNIEPGWIAAGASAAMFFLTAALIISDRSKRGPRIEQALQKAISDLKLDDHTDISALRFEMSQAFDKASREFGEVGTALRHKIHEVELFMRDRYVSKDTFNEVTRRISSDVQTDFARLETQLTRLEGKIDKQNAPPKAH